MKIKRILLCILCGLGSGMIGIFAGRLNTVPGIIFFALGVAVVVFAIFKISKD